MTCEPCRKCGEYAFQGHTCPPAWRIWRADHGETEEDAQTFYGMSAETAVEKWASRSDARGDYEIVGGSEATVQVRLVDVERAEFLRLPIEVLEVDVYGETVPSYHAIRRVRSSTARVAR